MLQSTSTDLTGSRQLTCGSFDRIVTIMLYEFLSVLFEDDQVEGFDDRYKTRGYNVDDGDFLAS